MWSHWEEGQRDLGNPTSSSVGLWSEAEKPRIRTAKQLRSKHGSASPSLPRLQPHPIGRSEFLELCEIFLGDKFPLWLESSLRPAWNSWGNSHFFGVHCSIVWQSNWEIQVSLWNLFISTRLGAGLLGILQSTSPQSWEVWGFKWDCADQCQSLLSRGVWNFNSDGSGVHFTQTIRFCCPWNCSTCFPGFREACFHTYVRSFNKHEIKRGWGV